MGRFTGESTRNRSRARRCLLAFVLVSAVAPPAVAPAPAAATVPEVEYRVATQVSSTEATLEVQINPEGSATHFEIFLECQEAPLNGGNCEPLTVGRQQDEWEFRANLYPETVTRTMVGLQPGYTYRYSAIASNASGREGFTGAGFVTCPSQGSCPMQPWRPGESLWVMEAAAKAGAEAPRLEAEREAAAREAAERATREAAERATREREAREASECVVPLLKGDSLVKAVHALSKTKCILGHVSRKHGHQGPLVVIKQSALAGTRLAGGSPVTVTLGARPKR